MRKLSFSLLLAAIPLMAPVIIFIVVDPFMVVHNYKSFRQRPCQIDVFDLNRDYIGIELFRNNYDSMKYDSYIFGNSNGRAYYVENWEKHIRCHNAMHMDAYYENLFGITGKLKLLQQNGARIKNALIIVDSSLLSGVENVDGSILRKHPLVSGENKLYFTYKMFRYFLEPGCLVPYLRAMFDRYSIGKITPPRINNINELANEEQNANAENMLAAGIDSFYSRYRIEKLFSRYTRDNRLHYMDRVIGEQQLPFLKEIKKRLDHDSCIYRIVVSPMYCQRQLDTNDLATLKNVFGANNVFDLSGISDITNDVHNYYDTLHYRAATANRIMDSIYK